MALLCELASDDQLMVSGLTERAGLSADATSKTIVLLRETRIVIKGNRLYQIACHPFADKTEHILDFRYCILRMNVGLRNS